MWISRDEDGTLMLSIAKPKKFRDWWEDTEPVEVELRVK